MAKTRIFVLKRKKLLTIAIPVAIGLILLILLFALRDKKEPAPQNAVPEEPGTSVFCPGVYNSVLTLNDVSLNLEVIVDADHINSVRLVNLSEAVTAMYPLMEPSIQDISSQLAAGTELSDITISESTRYTQMHLINGIRETLTKAYAK